MTADLPAGFIHVDHGCVGDQIAQGLEFPKRTEPQKAKIWEAPHEFNREMQNEAFAWLDRQFNR